MVGLNGIWCFYYDIVLPNFMVLYAISVSSFYLLAKNTNLEE